MTPEFDKFDIRAEIPDDGEGQTKWLKLSENLSVMGEIENALRYRVFGYYKFTDMTAVKEFSEIPDLQTLENEFTVIAPIINKFRARGNPVVLE